VETRGAWSAPIEPIGIGATEALIATACDEVGAMSSCAYEFHALQSGQRPSHFEAWAPHSVQEKTTAFFATDRMVTGGLARSTACRNRRQDAGGTAGWKPALRSAAILAAVPPASSRRYVCSPVA
jgi:hypothetical protein